MLATLKEVSVFQRQLSASGSGVKSTFASRLRLVIGDASVLSYAKKCGLSDGLVRKYLISSLPSVDKLVILAVNGGVEIKWLATGEGPMRPGDEAAVPVAFDIELMGKIMAVFIASACNRQVSIPSKDIGEMAAKAYQDILSDFPDPENQHKALKQLATIAANISRLYE
jgi:hypothetical protein